MKNNVTKLVGARAHMIRVGEVARRFDSSVRWVWRKTASDPSFPKPVKTGTRSTRWYEHEIEAYLSALAADRN